MSAFVSRPKFSLSPLVFLLLLLHFKPTTTESLHLQIPHPACEGTLYPQLCVSTLSSIPNLASKSLSDILSSFVTATVEIVHSSASSCTELRNKLGAQLALLERRALDDCVELFGSTISELHTVVSDLLKISSSPSKLFHDIQTLLSAAITNQYTCLDGFAYTDGNVRKRIDKRLYDIAHLLSSSLTMLSYIPQPNWPKTTTEVSPGYGKMVHRFPQWVSPKDRRLLRAHVNQIEYDLLVAKDGSGNFTTINDAVNAAPNNSKDRFVIRIKAGGYFENVNVTSKKTNLMFVGDGIGKTVVKANRNVVDGWTTFQSATVGTFSWILIAP